MKEPLFVVNGNDVKNAIAKMCNETPTRNTADARTRKYYEEGGTMVWVNRYGVRNDAHLLLRHLKESVTAIGFSESAFYISPIEADLKRFDELDFDSGENSVSKVLARLEYNLTRACARYIIGQRYGFTNPNYTFNRLDSMMSNTTNKFIGFRLLYDLKSERPSDSFIDELTRKIANDSIAEYLAEAEPQDTLYKQLKGMLQTAHGSQRTKIMTNMERCRWRFEHSNTNEGKTLVVNIPSFMLQAYEGGRCTMEMKIGCGERKTKTPILYSQVERIEINPQWHIPMSIITKDIVRHIGDTAYFERNKYYVADRKTGERIDIGEVTAAMLHSGEYRVSQEGGEGNSLGRIVFRFKNNMSVYLHDTNSRGFFSRDVRAISHGCVRVERPFDLATFVLGESVDEWTLDKIRISMDLPPETDKGKKYVREHEEETHNLISNKAINPPIPVYILYFTLFPNATGSIESYPDIYGYDAVIEKEMTTYTNL